MNNTKQCKQCNVEFGRPYGYSAKQWEIRQFCSKSCKHLFNSLHLKPKQRRTKEYYKKFLVDATCTKCGIVRKVDKFRLAKNKTGLCHSCNGKTKRTHGMTGTRPHDIWAGMKIRCNNKNNNGYKWYGALGITYSPKWETFEGFWEDMKSTYADNLTLDRIDPKGNYCKENCRWVTMQIQGDNTKNSIYYTYKGEKLTIRQLSNKYNIPEPFLRGRMEHGWDVKEAIETPKLANQFAEYSKRKTVV